MQDSAGIKRHNKSFIRKVLLQGQPYSKQQIARQTVSVWLAAIPI